ncbi:FHA domain-containing protein FhaB/FipA [Protaetiibacter mangrovi]|uniref:FHA domain-containing protein n=2 Tax=Microbacteriaceae TaxID=85023 RepID=A0ABT1ZHC3_9MICO|nr:FHA domain-containing protein [Protaetiibacter mangrovi]MCS0500117.1 FHA domain-containing protein [Protaetiibacter mangrovi]TPX05602.1 FHA domain-containing protein [Schumannella luteola]
MSELTLLVLRIGFLILMWAFVFMVVYALRSDLFGHRARKLPPQAAPETFPATPLPVAVATPPAAAVTEPVRAQPHASGATPRRLVITSGPKEGMEIELPTEQLTIGRSSESGLVIRDDYTSTHHARLMLWNDEWVIQDLDSTNGTFLDGSRVTLPTPVPLGSTVTIGTTSFELRR